MKNLIKKLFRIFNILNKRISNIIKIDELEKKKRTFDKIYWSKYFELDEDALKVELQEHSDIAKKCKLGIVEIGILFGDTSRVLAQSNISVPVYGIDPLIPDSMNSTLVGTQAAIKKNTEDLKNFHFINDFSFNVIKNWDYPFDYLFIDGSHIYEDVKKDFEDWYPKLAKGGIISLHDSTMFRGGQRYWEGPSRVADELIFDERLEFIKSKGRVTVFRKK